MSIYDKVPLRSDGVSFRLLHLEPTASIDDPLVCHLETVTANPSPTAPYEALSYCWESPIQDSEITCNDETISIIRNLYHALLHLRRQNSRRTIWIDAICINQNDMAERSAQIRLMRHIYSTCEQVVVWLGPDPHADGAHHLFELAERPPRTDPEMVKSQLGPLLGPTMTSAIADRMVSDDPDAESSWSTEWTQELYDGVAAAMKRSWWTRTWVIQEIALAPDVSVVCGHLSTSWPRLRHAFLLCLLPAPEADGKLNLRKESARFYLDDAMSIAYSRITVTRPAEREKDVPSRELSDLLGNHRWSMATDARDNVYGLLALAKSTYGIVPDYSMSIASCYAHVTYAIMCGAGNLQILESVIRPSCVATTLTGLASWVPDWSYDISSVPQAWRAREHDSSFFKPVIRDTWIATHPVVRDPDFPQESASGLQGMTTPPKLSPDGRILTLRGYFLTGLSLVGPKLDYLPSAVGTRPSTYVAAEWKASRGMGNLLGIIREWESIATRSPIIRTQPHESIEDAYLTTMYKNHFPSAKHRRAALDHARSCKSIMIKPFKSVAMLKKLGLRHVSPDLYHNFLGFRDAMSLKDDDDIRSFAAFSACLIGAVDRRLGRSEGNHLVLLPHDAREGDRIALFEGGRTPFVVRRAGDRWRLVGDCYVHGIMLGEAWVEERCEDVELC